MGSTGLKDAPVDPRPEMDEPPLQVAIAWASRFLRPVFGNSPCFARTSRLRPPRCTASAAQPAPAAQPAQTAQATAQRAALCTTPPRSRGQLGRSTPCAARSGAQTSLRSRRISLFFQPNTPGSTDGHLLTRPSEPIPQSIHFIDVSCLPETGSSIQRFTRRMTRQRVLHPSRALLYRNF